jgi:hypothetical protein
VGPAASIVGAASMGLEAAPYSEILQTNRYRQYIVLFRLRRHAGTEAVTAEFAGVLDPEGHTIRARPQAVELSPTTAREASGGLPDGRDGRDAALSRPSFFAPAPPGKPRSPHLRLDYPGGI